MNEFSRKLKKLRQSRGLTQADVAVRLGISASTVGMYEQGRREPDLETMQKICKLYNVTPDYLVNADFDAPSEISDMINEIRARMKQSQGMMFDGVPVSAEDTEKIFDAMLLAARLIMESNDSKEGESCNRTYAQLL